MPVTKGNLLGVKSVRRSVVDVGTNSVKLLVADVHGQEVRPVFETSQQTRLGEGFYTSHVLQEGPISQTAKAVAAFAVKAAEMGAEPPRVVATSAARDAKNQTDLTSAIEKASGLRVQIISGDEEATYGFLGVMSDPSLAREPLLLLDVGGGSSEFILGHHDQKPFTQSFALGTVRLLEEVRPADPPEANQLAGCRRHLKRFLESEIIPRVTQVAQEKTGSSSVSSHFRLVGIGGTASILACMEAKLTTFDRERLEATSLTSDRMHWHVEHLWGMPIAERRRIPGLPANRADVILTGAAIYEAVMQHFGFGQLRVSTRGLRFAIVIEGNKSSIER